MIVCTLWTKNNRRNVSKVVTVLLWRDGGIDRFISDTARDGIGPKMSPQLFLPTQNSTSLGSARRENNCFLCCFFKEFNDAICDDKKGNVLMGT